MTLVPYAFFRGEIVPLADAKVGVMTHAFNYGTAVFEGIRGNWNPEDERLYLFRMAEHYTRLFRSAKLLNLGIRHSVQELCDLTVEVVARCGYTEDVYVRPIAYKASEVLGVRVHDLEDEILIFVAPFGPYLDLDVGARCGVSSWRRIDDNSIPPRGKITGLYVNSALAKSEAVANGYDEAIVLNHAGNVSEGSGENIFLVEDGALVTPSVSEDILVGITRQTIIELARDELGIETIERPVGRSELYMADEVFMTGTAAHVTPITEIDHRPVDEGQPGPLTKQLQRLYLDAERGRLAKYRAWCTPVPARLQERVTT